MRTTIPQDKGDRRGVACDGRTLDEIVADARRIFADTSAALELHVDALKRLESREIDPSDVKDVSQLIRDVQGSWRTVLELEAKVGARAPALALDLEAARAEIESRLDRLLAIEAA